MRLSGIVKGTRNGVDVDVTITVDSEGALTLALPGGQAGGRARIPAAEFMLDREGFDQVVAGLDAAHQAMLPAKIAARGSGGAAVNGGQRSRPGVEEAA